MGDVFFERLTLFEGVLIGIYGNWLIAFIDWFIFSEPTALWTIGILLFLAFVTFLLFFVFCWLSSKPKFIAMIFGTLHLFVVILASLLEAMTRPIIGIKFGFFILIGLGIFFLLVAFVVTKSQYEERFRKS